MTYICVLCACESEDIQTSRGMRRGGNCDSLKEATCFVFVTFPAKVGSYAMRIVIGDHVVLCLIFNNTIIGDGSHQIVQITFLLSVKTARRSDRLVRCRLVGSFAGAAHLFIYDASARR